LFGAAGPFNWWPNAWGFDHFWGFLGGESGQWDPVITENNKTIGVPQGKDGEKYYFPDDMADRTIEWLHAVRARTRASRGSCTSPPGARTPRTMFRKSGPPNTRDGSTAAGTPCGRKPSSGRSGWA
jgi:arylsulfatase A-like enzyme